MGRDAIDVQHGMACLSYDGKTSITIVQRTGPRPAPKWRHFAVPEGCPNSLEPLVQACQPRFDALNIDVVSTRDALRKMIVFCARGDGKQCFDYPGRPSNWELHADVVG